MSEEKKARVKRDTSVTARASLAKMSAEEIKEIRALIQHSVDERDFPRFKRGLLKLGYDEGSAEYQQLVDLWDAYAKSSRYP